MGVGHRDRQRGEGKRGGKRAEGTCAEVKIIHRHGQVRFLIKYSLKVLPCKSKKKNEMKKHETAQTHFEGCVWGVCVGGVRLC